MNGRLPSGIIATALIRRVNDAGGFAVVLAKGDAQAGGILLRLIDRTSSRLVERGIGADGATILVDSTPADAGDGYWRRRRARDPDLWVIELDSPEAERFAAEILLDD